MVLVEVDGNFINAEPMNNKLEGAMIKVYIALWTRLTTSGTVKPMTHILDSEASAKFKKEIQKNCKIQLVPLDNHRRNLAEQAIQTFKKSFQSYPRGSQRHISNAAMGQITTPEDTDPKSPQAIKCSPHSLGVPIRPW
jgi:hypothetical protein